MKIGSDVKKKTQNYSFIEKGLHVINVNYFVICKYSFYVDNTACKSKPPEPIVSVLKILNTSRGAYYVLLDYEQYNNF